jgi:DNA-binding NarL/FixJ family response regulator
MLKAIFVHIHFPDFVTFKHSRIRQGAVVRIHSQRCNGEGICEDNSDVAHDSKVLPPQFTGPLFAQIVEHTWKRGKGRASRSVSMTKREREILVFIADGPSNKEIAKRLNDAVYIGKSHVHNILEKLTLHSKLLIAKYTRHE